VKEQPPDEEKFFGTYTSDRGLITKIHNDLKKISNKQQVIHSTNGND
jgi:hypothetical protein